MKRLKTPDYQLIRSRLQRFSKDELVEMLIDEWKHGIENLGVQIEFYNECIQEYRNTS